MRRGRNVALALLTLTALSTLACQRKNAPPNAASVVPAQVHCARGTQVVRQTREEWCARSDGTRDGPFVSFADETRKTRATEGQYENGKQAGRWTFTSAGVLLNEDNFRNGVRHGPWRANYPDGAPELRAEYDEGREHGEWTWWHENGVKKALKHYEHGLEIGRSEAWDSEARLTSSIDYRAGVLHGHYFIASAEAASQTEGNYVGGRREGRWVWTYLSQECPELGRPGPRVECWPPGPASVGNYQGGQREGLWSAYHQGGNLESQGRYRSGKKEGVWRYFSFEGKPSVVISCRAGHAHGSYREWQDLTVPGLSSPIHHLALRGEFFDGEPIGAWWLTQPGDRPLKTVCKLDEPCHEPRGSPWSDDTEGCESVESVLE